MVYHYTDIKALQGMCSHATTNIPIEYIIVRAHNILYMEDQDEMKWKYDDLFPYIIELEEKLNIPLNERLTVYRDYYAFIPSFDIIELSTSIYANKKNLEFCPYAVSLSYAENDDYLWENYGDMGKGVCIAFDELGLQKLNSEHIHLLSNIFYLNKEGELPPEHQVNLMSLLEICYNIYLRQKQESDTSKDIWANHKRALKQILLVLPALVKPYNYEVEQELRLLVFCSQIIGRKFSSNKNGRPYLELYTPISSIKQIYVRSQNSYNTLTNWMSDNNSLHVLLPKIALYQ